MADDINVNEGGKGSEQWKQFLSFRTRKNYLDLPDSGYKPSLTVDVLEAINKFTMALSSFGLIWFAILTARLYLGLFFYASLMFGLILLLSGLSWQIIQGRLGVESMIAIAAALVGGLTFWLVQFS